MEMELDKRSLTVFETVSDASAMHDESCDMIVPDASPDIMRIICARGAVHIKDKTPREGRVDISGTVKGCVLYLSEGDEVMRRLEVVLPFSFSVESARITESSCVHLSAWLQGFEAREVNPRKISVRAVIGTVHSAYEPCELSVCTGVKQAEEYALEMKYRSIPVYAPIAVKEKTFTITDDLELPRGKPQPSAIMCGTAHLGITDMKIIGNKAIIKGNAYLSYLYQTQENALASCEHEMPFSQIIDAEGMNEDCRLRVKLAVRGVELECRHDMSGDVRFVSASIQAEACVLAYYDGEIDAVEDIYSTRHELSCSFSGRAVPSFSGHISKRVAVTETLETAVGIAEVLDMSVATEPARKKVEDGGEMLVCDGVIELVYRGEDGGVYCASGRCSIVCPVGAETSAAYDCRVAISGKSYSSTGGSEAIVRFFADFDADAVNADNAVMIDRVELDTESTKNGEGTPSVIIKYINTDMPLWDTAKRYNTTVREIAAANALEDSEIVRAGSMLLIPKAR